VISSQAKKPRFIVDEMPINSPTGFLDITNAALRTSNIITSNLHFRGSSNVFVTTHNEYEKTLEFTHPTTAFTTVGNVEVGGTLTMGNIAVEALHSLEAVTAVGNTTPLTVEFSNANTGIVTTGNVEVGKDLTVTGNLNVTTVMSDSNVVAEYTGPHDRPLRKYPEVALTANSDRGYVASASSTATYDTNLQPKNAFNGVISPSSGTASWQSSDSGYSGTTPFNYLNAGTHTVSLTDTDGTVHYGDWLSLQTPNRIKVSYYKIHTLNDVDNYRPDSFILLGSNSETDGTWKLLHTETSGMTDPGPEVYTGHVNSTEFYTYHRLLVKSLAGNGGEAYINELEYYGHEEGDASLDTTLKSVYNVPATTGTQLEVYYDAKDLTTMPATVTDLSPNSNGGSVTGATLDTTDGIESFKFVTSSSQYIEKVFSGYTQSTEYSASVWFKSDSYTADSTIFQLGLGDHSNGSGIGMNIESEGPLRAYIYGYGSSSQVSTSVDSIATGTWYHATATYYSSGKIELYINGVLVGEGKATQLGTINASAPLTLGTYYLSSTRQTPSFSGSIANFRLYSKALNADQVKELYDYQKDYFLGSKSQVTLYKGHLGVGVTEPSGQLELAGDERIQEYPPGPMDDYETLIPGHGVFTAIASSKYTTADTFVAWKAFDKTEGTFWVSDDTDTPETYDQTTGLYTGTRRLSEESVLGEYIILKLPYSINLKSFTIEVRSTELLRGPKSGIVYGRKNNNWEVVHSFSGVTYTTAVRQNIQVINQNEYYNEFALVTTALAPNGSTYHNINLVELKYFGTPGPTTLDKGSLSLTRSLDVPRVSRYDVDTETPRPEKLVVDFDTTHDNNAADISGNGNNGMFENNLASYSAAERAFNFDGNNGVVLTGPISPTMTGDRICSMSAWFKTTNASTANQTIMWLGAYANGGLLLVSVTNGTLRISIGSGCSLDVAGVIESNTWYHVVGIKQGTGSITSSNFSSTFKLYLNGEPVTGTFGGTARTLNVTSDYWFVGAGNASGNEAFSGYISNPKLYDTILEPSEIRKLYNLGRTGRSMVITDTAVGIGKAPETQLDVRGSAAIAGYLGIGTKPGDSFGGALHVAGRHGVGLENSTTRRYFKHDTGFSSGGGGARGSIYALYDIVTSRYFIATGGTASASDERIKKNIIDVDDSSALDTLRLLKPKRYEYRDTVERGTEPVWGFIAQEVRDTLPYATHERSDFVPNIYQLANVSDSNVITFSDFNTSELEDSAILKVVSSTDEEHEVRIIETIDDTTIRVNTNLDGWTGSVDDEGNVVSGNKIFVYGQKVDDFIFVKKDAIWTIATAALQEVDRQLQVERARNDTLEARIEALENAS